MSAGEQVSIDFETVIETVIVCAGTLDFTHP